MKNNYNSYRFLSVVFLLMSLLHTLNATLITYPGLPGDLYKSTRYTVSVTQTGNSYDSYVYNSVNTFTETTGSNRPMMTDDNNFCSFSFDGSVVVTVSLPLRTTTISSVEIRPKIKGIIPTWSANNITIPISTAGNYYVYINGEEKNPLFIFANPLEVNPPAASGDANIEYFTPDTFTPTFTSAKTIWYFAPGLYDSGVSGGTLTNIPSGTTVYLAGGVYLKGRLTASVASTALTVKGRGIISGIDLPYVAGSYGTALIGGGSNNKTALNLEGVILTDPPQQLCMTYSSGSTIDNLKLLSWYVNSDGISVDKSSTVKNCFLKVNDDNLKPMKNNQTFKDNVVWVQVFGSALQFSWNIAIPTSNILVDGLDIVGFDKGNQTGVNTNASVVSFQNLNGGSFSSNIVQNIRSDVKVYKIFTLHIKSTQTGFTQGLGTVDGMLFKNFSIPMGTKYLSTFDGNGTATGEIKNITFQDVKIGGTLLTDANASTYLTRTGLTSNFLYTTLPNSTPSVLQNTTFKCKTIENGIQISNLTVGDSVAIYGIAGNLISNQKVTNPSLEISLAKGLYLIRVENQAVKIILQ